MEMRRCSICVKHKPIEVFTPMGGKRVGNRTSTCTPCRTAYNRKRREANPKRIYEIERRSKMKQQYDITIDNYDAMLTAQNGGCAICGDEKPGGRTRYFAVDHCHTTGVVRGLLCTKCNRGLGLFNDDTVRIERAVNYLKGDLSWP
jgi:hypothetical protein